MARWRLLLHPAFLGAIIVLALNDHVLKGLGPASITGKLSDLAGVFAVALLACVVIRKPELAVALTGVLFAALKLSPTVGALAVPVFGGRTLQDPSDLVALIVLWPALLIARQIPPSAEPVLARRLLMTGSLVAFVLTMTATSCLRPEFGLLTLDEKVLFFDSGFGEPEAVSSDGGQTWTAPRRGLGLSRQESERQQVVIDRHEACTDSGYCFRVTSDALVEERPPGGSWTRTFEFSDRERLNARLHEEGLDIPNPFSFFWICDSSDDLFSHTFSAVTVVEIDGVQHAVVAMGEQGVLHKLVGSEWERRAAGPYQPPPLDEPSWLTWLKVAAATVMVGSLALLGTPLLTRSRGSRASPGGALGLAVVAATLSAPLFLAGEPMADVFFVASVCLILASAYAFLIAGRQRDTFR